MSIYTTMQKCRECLHNINLRFLCFVLPKFSPILLLLLLLDIIRPHRSTTYADAAYCYRPSSVVCRSVCQSVTAVSHAEMAEPINLGIRRGPDSRWKGAIMRRKKAAHCKVVQKRQNRSIFHLGCGLWWSQGSVYQVAVHTGATWQIPLNRPCAAAMQPAVKLL